MYNEQFQMLAYLRQTNQHMTRTPTIPWQKAEGQERTRDHTAATALVGQHSSIPEACVSQDLSPSPGSSLQFCYLRIKFQYMLFGGQSILRRR